MKGTITKNIFYGLLNSWDYELMEKMSKTKEKYIFPYKRNKGTALFTYTHLPAGEK